jgi:hypothetical protein
MCLQFGNVKFEASGKQFTVRAGGSVATIDHETKVGLILNLSLITQNLAP